MAPSLLSDSVNFTKTILKGEDTSAPAIKNRSIFLERHNSDVMHSLSFLMKESFETENDAIFNLISGYLKILEVLIIVDLNLNRGLDAGIMSQLIRVTEHERCEEEDKGLAFKLIGSAMRNPKAFDSVEESSLVKKSVEILQKAAGNEEKAKPTEDDVLAAMQIVNGLLSREKNKPVLVSLDKMLAENLFKVSLSYSDKSDFVFITGLSALSSLYQTEEELAEVIHSKHIEAVVQISEESEKEQ